QRDWRPTTLQHRLTSPWSPAGRGRQAKLPRSADASAVPVGPQRAAGKRHGYRLKAKLENSDRGDAVDLHVERTVPGGHADEAARRRVRRKIPRVDRIDGPEMRRVGAIHVALDDLVERRAGRRQAELHLLEHDLGLSFDRQALDLAGGRIVRR